MSSHRQFAISGRRGTVRDRIPTRWDPSKLRYGGKTRGRQSVDYWIQGVTFSGGSGGVEVHLTSDTPIAGFQFSISGINITAA